MAPPQLGEQGLPHEQTSRGLCATVGDGQEREGTGPGVTAAPAKLPSEPGPMPLQSRDRPAGRGSDTLASHPGCPVVRPPRTALPFTFQVALWGVHKGVSVCRARPGARPDRQASRQGGAGRQAQGRRKAGTTALIPGRLGGQDSQSAQAWRVGEHTPIPLKCLTLRPASKPQQRVPRGTPFPARATLGWSFGPGRPRAVRAPRSDKKRLLPLSSAQHYPPPSQSPLQKRGGCPPPLHRSSRGGREGVCILGSHA